MSVGEERERLQGKYRKLTDRMSKSTAAIARRIITLLWVPVTMREFYKDMSKVELIKKLRYYKLDRMVWEALAP
ncbi:MAG: hypothetical protein LBB61_09820 [Treponema sp.]|nr:hypothetical protein [Treponema sp.]